MTTCTKISSRGVGAASKRAIVIPAAIAVSRNRSGRSSGDSVSFTAPPTVTALKHARERVERALAVHDDDVAAPGRGVELVGIAFLDLAQSAVEHAPAAIDHRDPVAQLFGLIHLVGGQHDEPALALEREDDVLHHPRVDGVESGERLVEDDDLGVVEERRHDLHLLLHPLRERVDPLRRPLREADPLERGLAPSL